MASPQVEDGYTRIANELMEALIRAELPSVQTRIVLIIMRETYGFQRKTVKIGYQALTSRYRIGRTLLIREMATLVERRVLTKEAHDSGNIWGIQKDYTQWVGSHPTDTSQQAETSHQKGQRLVTLEIPVTSHPTETTSKKEKERKKDDVVARAREAPPPPTGIESRLFALEITPGQIRETLAANPSFSIQDVEACEQWVDSHPHKLGILIGTYLKKGLVPPLPRRNGHVNGLAPPPPELTDAERKQALDAFNAEMDAAEGIIP